MNRSEIRCLGKPLREEAIGTTRGRAKGETLTTSGPYRRHCLSRVRAKPVKFGPPHLADPVWSDARRAADLNQRVQGWNPCTPSKVFNDLAQANSARNAF